MTTNQLYAQLDDDGTITNICVTLDVGSYTEFPSGAQTLFGIAEAEALGWAWLGAEDSPTLDPTTGLVPAVGWTATLATPATLAAGVALPTEDEVLAGGKVATVAPTPAVWTFSPPAQSIDPTGPVSPATLDPAIT